jgi:hypothetical protein
VHELYEARLNRTLWQIVYEFDRERAEAALEYLRQRYGEPESRVVGAPRRAVPDVAGV